MDNQFSVINGSVSNSKSGESSIESVRGCSFEFEDGDSVSWLAMDDWEVLKACLVWIG